MSLRNFLKSICVFIILTVYQTSYANKSVFIISNHNVPSKAEAFEIDGDQIYFQSMFEIDNYNPGIGAVGIDIWPEKELMFVTYENSGTVTWSSTKTLQFVGRYDTGVPNLAGVVVDNEKEKIYIMHRPFADLLIYRYDQGLNTLVYESTQIFKNQSSQNIAGWGLALDEVNDLLYVSTNSKTVYVYDTNSWTLSDYFDIRVGANDRSAIGIAVDPVRGYLYTGHFNGASSEHTYLVKTSLSDPNTSTEVSMGTSNGVVGIDVDVDSGLIYCTTKLDQFRVYNISLSLRDTETNSNMTSPAGVAVGSLYKPPLFTLNKVDDISDCVIPDDVITYTINYDANGHSDTNVVITDYLSPKVDINDINDANYNPANHTCTWDIGTLSPTDSGYVTLKVKVNECAEPNGVISNYCEIESSLYCTTATEDTNVGFWQPDSDIIYVDRLSDCTPGTGMSWRSAYIDLQDALERAASGFGSEIWVAAGTYKPTTNPADYDANFALVDGVAIYGGFDGNETGLNQRNWLANETILTGDANMFDVVTATNVTETASIDGFTITKGSEYGIRCSNASPTIRNNKIKDNYYYDGVYCVNNSPANITNCEILNNGRFGVYCDDSNSIINDCNINGSYNSNSGIYCSISSVIVTGCNIQNNKSYGIRSSQSNLTISNCIIKDNRAHGIYCVGGPVTTIKNNWIYNNGTSGTGSGIYFYSDPTSSIVRNNTIVDNDDYGIAGAGNPNISNCIFWYNRAGSLDWIGYNVTYSCIQGVYSGQTNIDDDPCFVAPDANNYHIDPNVSPCIDAGDPLFTDPNRTETDIDGEPRITEIVDIGADEFYWSPADFDRDKIVNFIDYAELAAVWLTTSVDPDYNDLIDLQDNNSIDFNDHAVFASDWLWQAAWPQAEPLQFMNAGIGQGMIQSLDFTEGLETSAPAEQQSEQAVTEEPVAEPVDIEALIQWLDEIWLSGDLKESMTEEQYLEFRKAVEESAF